MSLSSSASSVVYILCLTTGIGPANSGLAAVMQWENPSPVPPMFWVEMVMGLLDSPTSQGFLSLGFLDILIRYLGLLPTFLLYYLIE